MKTKKKTKQERLLELDEMQDELYELYEKGELTEDELDFELYGIEVSRTIVERGEW